MPQWRELIRLQHQDRNLIHRRYGLYALEQPARYTDMLLFLSTDNNALINSDTGYSHSEDLASRRSKTRGSS